MEELPYFKQFVSEKLQKGTQRNDILEVVLYVLFLVMFSFENGIL